MSLDTLLQVNDVGVSLTITVVGNDGSTPINLSGDTSTMIYLYRPDGSLLTESATFVTDGTDGQIRYVTQTGDLFLSGLYKIQASYLVSGQIKHTQKGIFTVATNIPGVN